MLILRSILVLVSTLIATDTLLAQYPNYQVTPSGLTNVEEVSIAINPLNVNQLAVGGNINFLATSTDAGHSWSTGFISSQYKVWGDPTLMFDDSGYLYYGHLSGIPDTTWIKRIIVQRSPDAGATWDQDVSIGYDPPTQQDKAWLALDRSTTSRKGNILTSWTRFDHYGSLDPRDSSRIFFAQSMDLGVTWSSAVRVDDNAGDCYDSNYTDEGAVSAAGPNGEIYIAWAGGGDKIYFDKSTDGGKSFGKDYVLSDQPGGWAAGISGFQRSNGLPMTLCDPSSSKYHGRIYVLWADNRRGVSDIYLMHSDDAVHWSERVKVNTDIALQDHFFPNMTVDPVTGRIYVIFYDRRNHLDNETDVYMARSTDGGDSFDNMLVSESAFLPSTKVFMGDYIHIVAYDHHVHPVWTRMDEGATSIWTADILDTTKALSVSADPVSENSLTIYSNSAAQLSVVFSLHESANVKIEVLDLFGRSVQAVTAGYYGANTYHVPLDLSPLTHSTYFLRMSASNEPMKNQLVKFTK